MKRYYKEEISLKSDVFRDHIAGQAKKHNLAIKRNVTKDHNRTEEIDLIRKYLGNVGSILCLGCRDDSEVLSFIDAGFQAKGVDICQNSSLITETTIETIDKHFATNEFDFMYSRKTLEHVLKPELCLKNIRRISRRGCYLILPEKPDCTRNHTTVFDIMCLTKDQAAKHDKNSLFENFLRKDFFYFTDAKLKYARVGAIQWTDEPKPQILRAGEDVHLIFEW